MRPALPLHAVLGMMLAALPWAGMDAADTGAKSPPDTAAFIGLDAKTGGAWTTKFGGDGYMLPDGSASTPAQVRFVLEPGVANYIWAAGTEDPRALARGRKKPVRIADCWYGGVLNLDVYCLDPDAHVVSLYVMDWDNCGRTAHVDVLASNGTVLNAKDLASFTDGVYASWKVSGHVTIRVTNTGPQNAVLSGFFFGGPRAAGVVAAATP